MAPDLNCSTPPDAMKGYLRKSKKLSKRYFVLREHPTPRLEYYDSVKCYSKSVKPKRTIALDNAWNIDKKVTSKHKYVIGIYTEEEYFAMVAEKETEQNTWVNALKNAVVNFKGHANSPHTMYRHIWQGCVDTKGLENCDNTARINLQGLHRCCLTDRSMVFIRVNNSGASDLQYRDHVEINIEKIRACGHTETRFFMEPGRTSGIGTGILWMELDDSAIADNMHKKVLDLMSSRRRYDDMRPRSYSSGSGSVRTGNRSRHYFNPPPSQVGMGKPPTSITNTPKSISSCAVSRNRCETFPATQTSSLSDEARYRTSSEGEATIKRPFPFHNLKRKPGSVSPGSRARVPYGKRPLHLQQSFLHFRTASLPGSYTSSSNSSVEHLNNQEISQNGHSPASSEGHGSSDEICNSPLTDGFFRGQVSHLCYDHRYSQMAPPPPSMPPQATPTISTSAAHNSVHTSEYEIMQPTHSRSPSIDDNLSCGTGASSLSSSPHVPAFLSSACASPDASFIYSQSPSQCSAHSHCSDFEPLYTPTSVSPSVSDNYDFALTSPGSSDFYPHEHSLQSPDYTPMTPGRVGASVTPTENKSGYVEMRAQTRSQPQDISSSRRRSLSDNRLLHGSYSPASMLSRSPDKTPRGSRSASMCMKCERTELPHSYPCQCASVTITAKRPSIPSVSCHGLKVDAQNDFSFDTSRPTNTLKMPVNHVNYSEDYAVMDRLARTVADVQLSTSVQNSVTQNGKESNDPMENAENKYHEYLHMSPVNVANSKKSVVGNVLSVVESAPNQITSSLKNLGSAKYPHQQNVGKPGQFSTNSLDRCSKHPRRRAKTFFASSLVAGHRHSSKTSKNGRKHSLRLSSDSRSTFTTDSSSNERQQSPSSPGGEYVSINYDKAKKQVGPNYVSLSTTPGESGDVETSEDHSLCNRLTAVTPKATHDSNRNLLNKESPVNEDYTVLKPGNISGGS